MGGEYTSRLVRLEYPGGVYRFSCTRCGRCCSGGPNVALTVFDIARISLFLRLDPEVFLRNYTRVIVADIVPYAVLKGDEKGRCPFLAYRHDGSTLCVIYPVRPMRCRLYPILVESLRPHVYLDPESPGVGRGRLKRLPVRLIEQYVRERRRHYRILYRLIVEEGYPAIEALRKAVEMAVEEARRGAEWASPSYLDSLGET